MGQFLNTNGDYNIKTSVGSRITLDTGPGEGEVRITGDLRVEGNTVYVDVDNLEIKDNIIVLNQGETGAGVTLIPATAGIRIDRGTEPDVDFLWNDDTNSWELSQLNFGVGETPFVNSKLRIAQLLTDFNTDDGNLLVLGSESPDGVIHVTGTTNYQQQVIAFGDDAIPNKKYVDDAIQTNPTSQISRDNTRVIAFDSDDKLDSALFPIGPYQWPSPYLDATYPETQVGISIDGDFPIAQFFRNRIQFLNDGLRIFSEDATNDNPLDPQANAVVIQTVNTSANIKLETADTGKVQITYALQLDNNNVSPTYAPKDTSQLYAGQVDAGQTGIYHLSYAGPGSTTSGELINKNRALLFSMIF
jgi:hypothetical protein